MCKLLPGLLATLSMSQQEHAGFGTAMAVKDDLLAIGAPGQSWPNCIQCGAVFLVNLTTQEKLKVVVGEVAGGQFGQAVALSDIDGDGCADLVVSAPGEQNLNAYGAVHLYYQVLETESVRSDLRLYTNLPGVFGTRLYELEVGSLAIGSPWLEHGWLHGIRGLAKPEHPAQARIESMATWNLTIPDPSNAHGYDWFGWSAVMLRPWWFHGALVVGAPGVQVAGRSYGACFIWETDRQGRPIVGQWRRVLGTSINGQFGRELQKRDEATLLISSPTEAWGVPLAGCIRTISMAVGTETLPLVCGRQEGDRLGSSLGSSYFGAPGHGRLYHWQSQWECLIPHEKVFAFGTILKETEEHLIVGAHEKVQIYRK